MPRSLSAFWPINDSDGYAQPPPELQPRHNSVAMERVPPGATASRGVAGWPRQPSSFDITEYWQGMPPFRPEPPYHDENEDITIKVPKGVEWLGQVEDSEVLASTDLFKDYWIGHWLNAKGFKPTATHKYPMCEPFLTTKSAPFFHPSFTFNVQVHAVRVRLYDLWPKRRKRWDVIFAGRPGGAYKVTNNHIPVGGEEPQFEPFCPPLNAKLKFELRLTEAENERFDEKLTIMPAASAQKARLQWIRANSMKPRLVNYSKRHLDGALSTEEVEEIPGAGRTDWQGNVNYFSIPPLLVAASFADFL